MTTDEYCREIEAYLCRKNDGHLIRIVGPSFERVCGWAAQGIPFKIACQGIDAYFVRYYAKGTRRRPVQIDFCENDILDAFDAWRRAVGVRVPGAEADRAGGAGHPPQEESAGASRPHLRAGDGQARTHDAAAARVRRCAGNRHEGSGGVPRYARSYSRRHPRACAARLVELDRMMLDAARAQVDASALQAMRAEAAEELAPFRDRMPAESYQRAIESAVDRLIREREQLPTLTFEYAMRWPDVMKSGD